MVCENQYDENKKKLITLISSQKGDLKIRGILLLKNQRKISSKFSPKVIHHLPYDYHTIFTQNYSKLTFIKQICLRLELELAI